MPLHCIENCDDPMECPLCMEAFEMDDLSFYPCTCGYQICRFCWHRIRTDENGLCPACRKAYAENPADFKPLSSQELAKIKAEKKQKDHAKKQKAYENRKHLQNVRVVQNNLVFVVGLPPKMADPDVLKRTEYFGRFGKIHKVVLNHANHYAGQQVSGHKGPSCSAYVTYVRSDDALRAIQAVNNFCVDGRTLKASLGTTKYCSHFMKNQSCPKGDCMYLHEIGDESASFTKEDMQLGKHQEYERKLHESLIQSTMQQQQPSGASQPKETRTSISPQLLSTSAPEMSVSPNTKAGAWPSLDPATQHNNNKGEKGQNTKAPQQKSQKSGKSREKQQPKPSTSLPQQSRLRSTSRSPIELSSTQEGQSNPSSVTSSTLSLAAELDTVAPDEILATGSDVESKEFVPDTLSQEDSDPGSSNSGLPSSPAVNIPFSCISVDLSETRVRREESQSFFSSETFHVTKTVTTVPPGWSSNGSEDSGISDSLSNGSTNDWNIGAREDGALDLNSSPPPEPKADDDLGFDPFHETQKALAELVEKESLIQRNSGYQQQMGYSNMGMFGATQQRSRLPPPGFNPPGFNPPGMGLGLSNLPRMNQSADLFGSKLLSFRNTNSQLGSQPLGFGSGLGMTQPPQRPAEPPSMLGLNGLGLSGGFMQHSPQPMRPQQQPHTPLYGRAPEKDPYSVKEWQDRLKNLFPNINVTTGPMQSQPAPPPRFHSQMFGNQTHTDPSKAWRNPSSDWSAMDPAILSTGQLTERPDSPPHWLRSLEQLTEGGSQFGLPPPNHHLGNHQRHENTMWNPHPSHFGFGNQIGTAPPPGFSHMRLPKQMEAQKLIDNM